MSTEKDEMLGMLRDSVQRYAAEHYDFSSRKKILKSSVGYSDDAWKTYAELGWLAMRLPIVDGGIEADARTVGAVMETVGSHLLMEPLLASTILATGILQSAATPAQQQMWLPELASGKKKMAVALNGDCEWRDGKLTGSVQCVLHADGADRVIVAAQNMFCLVDPASAGVNQKNFRLVDGRGAANLEFNGISAEPIGTTTDETAIQTARDDATVALCAEALGAMRRLIEMTNAYIKIRVDFGKPIGSNQVLQHRMVDLHILQEETRALTAAAQDALDHNAPDRARIVSGAMAYISRAARKVANEAIQMHGGIGITEALEVSHYYRRIMVINNLFGSRDQHFVRFLSHSGAPWA